MTTRRNVLDYDWGHARYAKQSERQDQYGRTAASHCPPDLCLFLLVGDLRAHNVNAKRAKSPRRSLAATENLRCLEKETQISLIVAELPRGGIQQANIDGVLRRV